MPSSDDDHLVHALRLAADIRDPDVRKAVNGVLGAVVEGRGAGERRVTNFKRIEYWACAACNGMPGRKECPTCRGSGRLEGPGSCDDYTPVGGVPRGLGRLTGRRSPPSEFDRHEKGPDHGDRRYGD